MVTYLHRRTSRDGSAETSKFDEKQIVQNLTTEVRQLLDKPGTVISSVKETLTDHYQLENAEEQTRISISVQKVGITKRLALKPKHQSNDCKFGHEDHQPSCQI